MKRTIHIHIPKTAGLAMAEHAKRHAEGFQSLTHTKAYDPDVGYTTLGHVSAGSLMEHGVITQSQFDGSFKFTFVRNTWDRLVSLYVYFLRARPKARRDWKVLDSFDGYIRGITAGHWMVGIGYHNKRKLSQANPQTEWLRWGVDFIGRYETLDEDWRRLCDAVGMTHSPLERINPTEHGPYTDYYTDELRGLVAVRFAEEIDRFRFRFGERE